MCFMYSLRRYERSDGLPFCIPRKQGPDGTEVQDRWGSLGEAPKVESVIMIYAGNGSSCLCLPVCVFV